MGNYHLDEMKYEADNIPVVEHLDLRTEGVGPKVLLHTDILG